MKNNNTKYFKKFIKNNSKFYRLKKYSNRILVVSVTNDLIFNTILLKFGKIISEIESSNFLFLPFLKFNNQVIKLAKSFGVLISINIFLSFIYIFIKYFFKIFKKLIKINDGNELESFTISECQIGKHIYDFI